MALTPSTMLPLGTKAPDFSLRDTVSGRTVTLADFEKLTQDTERNGRLALRIQRGGASLYVALGPSGEGGSQK